MSTRPILTTSVLPEAWVNLFMLWPESLTRRCTTAVSQSVLCGFLVCRWWDLNPQFYGFRDRPVSPIAAHRR